MGGVKGSEGLVESPRPRVGMRKQCHVVGADPHCAKTTMFLQARPASAYRPVRLAAATQHPGAHELGLEAVVGGILLGREPEG